MQQQRLLPSSGVSSYLPMTQKKSTVYEDLNMVISSTLSIRGNSTNCVSIFKNFGGFAWDSQAYCLTPFTAPVTIEFNKMFLANSDNGHSYAMIGWNADPTTDASYTSLDYCAYPYNGTFYEVYHNGSSLTPITRNISSTLKFYIVYGTDGTIKHYNGSTLLYNVSYGIGNTVYLDSSFYSNASTFGGFSNIRVTKNAWNGTSY